MDSFTPLQTVELLSRVGAKKANARLDKMAVNSVMGSLLLGFGCAMNVLTLSSPWFQQNAPGLIRSISASFFPVGLIMVFLTGADLFTSYCMYSIIGVLHRRISVLDLVKTWAISYFSNLAGMLLFVIVIVGYGGVFQSAPLQAEAIALATAKVVTPGWHQIFLRGILANWLVCMAVFLSTSSREMISKIVAIWFPTMCFTAIGGDHVIANMFYIPLGIFYDAPVSVGLYIWKSMIPSALGNIVGGGLFVGALYWYLYLAGAEVVLSFDAVPLEAAAPELASGIYKELHGSHFQKSTDNQSGGGV